MPRANDLSARLGALERGGAALRRVGLGRLVTAAASRFGSRLSRFDTEINGVRLGGDRLGHLYYARELVADDRERFFRALFVDSIAAGATVLEGGPYIGYLTVTAALATGETGRVVAVEPNPDTISVLRANVTRNDCFERVRVIEAALGAEAGRAAFHVTEGGDTSSLHVPPHPTRVVDVDVVRGDDLLDRVDVVKLDLEGNEVAAIRGMRRLIEESGPVIFCECNPEMLQAAGFSTSDLLDELGELRYDVRWIDETTGTLQSLERPWERDYVNLRCQRA
jgi:FkbM family methyltransferase